jgi:hypothetical protein
MTKTLRNLTLAAVTSTAIAGMAIAPVLANTDPGIRAKPTRSLKPHNPAQPIPALSFRKMATMSCATSVLHA